MERLKRLLKEGGYTCVLSDGNNTFTSKQRGVAPLLKFIESGLNFNGYSAVDKVVGGGAALLYAYMGVKSVYCCVVSEQALPVFEKYGVRCEYEERTPRIINRRGDGICPIEQATRGIYDAQTALGVIKETLKNI